MNHFQLIVTSRIAEYKLAEEKREADEAAAAAQAAIKQAAAPVAPVAPALPVAALPVTMHQPSTDETGETINLGDITARLGFMLTADFLATLGFKPVAVDKNAKMFRAHDFPAICNALVDHINRACELQAA